jgi:glycosyltransferase involved in cell wall biosynthesis
MQKVSIITTTYNRQDILPLAIESALRQTYPNWEMIICDDGSTDYTSFIVGKYVDKRIKYINNGHQLYYTINRNQGVKKATGELMCFFDDDSIHHPEFLIEHVVRHSTKDVLITYSGRILHLDTDPTNVKFDDFPKLKGKAIPFMQYDGQTESMNGVVDVGDIMVKTKDILKVGGFTEEKDFPSYCSDMKLIDTLLNKFPEGKIVMIPRRLHHACLYGYDHMTQRKLEARQKGEMVDEQAWEWS